MKPISETKTQESLKSKLTPLQFKVTQQGKTQDPYTSKYYTNRDQYYLCKKIGYYKCIVCDFVLFSSEHKYDSGSGWPAFYDEVENANIMKIEDKRFGRVKTEIKCKCGSHLGHLFHDGPKEKTKIRYCVNSASLNFCQK